MEIIQITGYKNSGKTTMAEKLIHALAAEGFRVASLKHHGHGGTPDGFEDTDSARHHEAGAFISGVQGEGLLQLAARPTWELEQMTAIYQQLGTDILVVEGFKKHAYKKIVLIRREEDLHLLKELTNIVAVITRPTLNAADYPFLVFSQAEMDRCIEWLLAHFSH
ncbi:molybdopterin-guanine dinucleotide biosynthesis protein B [Lentibacillus sediminis]|uniref:molybdopterin-guanine dinucleotide biosynthesis protein B n=1 Tax=Lentibacillus sediminis TaxID=1940529 RepID=UPI000C1BCD71|nr:molybdopterin-guanine dinucleotide biosynthesis protein B [Lentibacillus sediminis]